MKDDIAVNELFLFAINEQSLYVRRIQPTCENLAKHYRRGQYSAEKAVRAFRYVADAAARLYNDGSSVIAFDAPTRRAAAIRLETHFRDFVAELVNAPGSVRVALENFGYDVNGNKIALHTVFDDEAKVYQQKRRSQVGSQSERDSWASPYVEKHYGAVMTLTRARGSVGLGVIELRYERENIDAQARRNDDEAEKKQEG